MQGKKNRIKKGFNDYFSCSKEKYTKAYTNWLNLLDINIWRNIISS